MTSAERCASRFTPTDPADEPDVDAPALDVCLAIRLAGVIDETRFVAAHVPINEAAVVEVEKERVEWHGGRVARVCFVRGDALPRVLQDAAPFRDARDREYALAVNGGLAHFDLRRALVRDQGAPRCGAAAASYPLSWSASWAGGRCSIVSAASMYARIRVSREQRLYGHLAAFE